MAQHQARPAIDKLDPVWARIRREAEDIVRREPELAAFVYSTILHHDSLEAAIAYRLAGQIDHPTLSGELIRQAYADALKDVPTIGEAFRADIESPLCHTHMIPQPSGSEAKVLLMPAWTNSSWMCRLCGTSIAKQMVLRPSPNLNHVETISPTRSSRFIRFDSALI